MESEKEAEALIRALTVDFEKEYEEGKLSKDIVVWLGILEMPRKLVATGDLRTDLVVSNLFDLACSMDEGFGAFVALNDEVEELIHDRTRCFRKKDALEEAATKARQKVQVSASSHFVHLLLYPFSINSTA